MPLHFTRAPVITFIIPMKSVENGTLSEFLQSYPLSGLFSDAAFWKTEVGSRTPRIPPPPHTDRKLARWAQCPSPHTERRGGWWTDYQVAKDTGLQPTEREGEGGASGCSFHFFGYFSVGANSCSLLSPLASPLSVSFFLLPIEIKPTRGRRERGCPMEELRRMTQYSLSVIMICLMVICPLITYVFMALPWPGCASLPYFPFCFKTLPSQGRCSSPGFPRYCI